jgi:hypothetical protein
MGRCIEFVIRLLKLDRSYETQKEQKEGINVKLIKYASTALPYRFLMS